jgi:hypothetical protein
MAKAVGADDGAGMHDRALADPHAAPERYARNQARSRPEHGVAEQHRPRTDATGRPDHAPGTDEGAGLDRGRRVDTGRWVHHRRRVYAARHGRLGVQQLRNARVGRVRVRMQQRSDATVRGERGLENHGGCPSIGEMTPIPRIGEKRYRAGAGVVERRNPVDEQVRIAAKLAAEAHRQFGKPHWHACAPRP